MPIPAVQYPTRTRRRDLAVGRFEFDTNDTGTPDGLVDPESIVTSLARSGVGLLTVTLAHKWTTIGAVATILDATAGSTAHVYDRTQGLSSTNEIKVKTELVGVLTDTNNKRVIVLVSLER